MDLVQTLHREKKPVGTDVTAVWPFGVPPCFRLVWPRDHMSLRGSQEMPTWYPDLLKVRVDAGA